jgi:hypothetical protein
MKKWIALLLFLLLPSLIYCAQAPNYFFQNTTIVAGLAQFSTTPILSESTTCHAISSTVTATNYLQFEPVKVSGVWETSLPSGITLWGWETPLPITGTISAGNWYSYFKLARSASTACSMKMNTRYWYSPNANMSGATAITSWTTSSRIISASSATWYENVTTTGVSALVLPDAGGDYIYMECALLITTAGTATATYWDLSTQNTSSTWGIAFPALYTLTPTNTATQTNTATPTFTVTIIPTS